MAGPPLGAVPQAHGELQVDVGETNSGIEGSESKIDAPIEGGSPEKQPQQSQSIGDQLTAPMTCSEQFPFKGWSVAPEQFGDETDNA